MFVFDYLNENLFHLTQRGMSHTTTRTVLKSALMGLAALHERHIVHKDIKANNIMVQTSRQASNLSVEKVEIVDLEDATELPAGRVLEGAHVGNIMWRSPEAHAMGPVGKPSDMFSFDIVCIYAMTQILLSAANTSKLEEGIEPLSVVLERQTSYFADQDGYEAFIQHLHGKDDWIENFEVIKGAFGAQQPRKPFALWKGFELEQENAFKDLIVRLTNFGPEKRLTAKEALEHKWFRDVAVI